MPDTDLAFRSGGFTLAGTFTSPDIDQPAPAALLLPGSGPIDRDGNHKRLRLDISRQLAQALAVAGIASFRFDKRGVDASGGSFRATGMLDNVADATAALDALRARPEVDLDRIYVIGHSEGALLAIALLAGGSTGRRSSSALTRRPSR